MHYKSTHACSPIMCVGWEPEMLPTLLYMYNTSFVPRRSPTRIDFSIHVRDTECAPHQGWLGLACQTSTCNTAGMAEQVHVRMNVSGDLKTKRFLSALAIHSRPGVAWNAKILTGQRVSLFHAVPRGLETTDGHFFMRADVKLIKDDVLGHKQPQKASHSIKILISQKRAVSFQFKEFLQLVTSPLCIAIFSVY